MGYQGSDGRWRDVETLTLAASAARTATANGTSVEVGDRGVACMTLDVTAVGGDADETLDVKLQTSEDGSTWRDVASFTQVLQTGGATSERKSFVGLDRFVRAVWTLAGTTPSFTFSVVGDAK